MLENENKEAIEEIRVNFKRSYKDALNYISIFLKTIAESFSCSVKVYDIPDDKPYVLENEGPPQNLLFTLLTILMDFLLLYFVNKS